MGSSIDSGGNTDGVAVKTSVSGAEAFPMLLLLSLASTSQSGRFTSVPVVIRRCGVESMFDTTGCGAQLGGTEIRRKCTG